MSRSILIAAFFLFSLTSVGQRYWTPLESARGLTLNKAVSRSSFPAEYKLYSLDADAIR
ncbi:MAG: hypothetical protein ACKO6Q_04090 [Bacteroidota bacterium]